MLPTIIYTKEFDFFSSAKVVFSPDMILKNSQKLCGTTKMKEGFLTKRNKQLTKGCYLGTII